MKYKSMEKVISSVEWFCKWVCENPLSTPEEIIKAYRTAKAMHKEETIKSWMAVDNELQRIAAEKYYNETFGE